MTTIRRPEPFIFIISLVVALQLVFVVDRADAICSAVPPDYPGCNQAQVEAIAKENRNTWFKKHRFGHTPNLLSGLTDQHAAMVKSATRKDIRQSLRRDAMRATKTQKVQTMAVWKTTWRGKTYTLNTFPYVRYVNQIFAGTDHSSTCWGRSSAYAAYAYSWCDAHRAPTGWENYWKAYYNWVEQPHPQTDMVCQKEIVVGTTTGAITGAFASIWTGPGIGLGALIGGGGGAAGGLVGCATNTLGQAVGWWK